MWVDHFARAARGVAGGGQQRHVGVGLDHRDVRAFAGGDHAVGEIVMADTIEHDHVQRADALDVLGARLVGVWVEPGRNQRHHLGLVADDIGHVTVIRVQRDADAQALGRFGVGERGEHQAEQANQQQAQQGR